MKHDVWGVRDGSEHLKREWERIQVGDKAIIYCARLGVIIGTAMVSGKRTKKEPWWDEDERLGKNIYPYIIELKNLKISVPTEGPEETWIKKGFRLHTFGLNLGHVRQGVKALRLPQAEEIFSRVSERIESKIPEYPPPPPEEPQHDRIRDLVMEVGLLLEKPAEKEYKIDDRRVDVVWKRIPQGNPTHAFEVQIGGDFFAALAKLKHAWDIWNAKPILVTTEEYMKEVGSWLSGSFHEMEHATILANWKDFVKLHEVLRRAKELRVRLGI